jgi:hypothetical protein
MKKQKNKATILDVFYPPINTFQQPNTIVPPWLVGSPTRAAGFPPMNTVAEPFAIVSGGPTQVHISPTTAAGSLPINTLGALGPVIGPPTCGIGDGKAGVYMGQVCISVILAAAGIFYSFYSFYSFS